MSVKQRVYEILDVAQPGDIPSKIFNVAIMTLIAANVAAVILETVEGLARPYKIYFDRFELFSVAIFSIEYGLRLWSCTWSDQFKKPIAGRFRFALTPLALVDLFAVLPFYLPRILPIDLRFIRALRLFRLFRLFKAARYSQSLKSLASVFRSKKEELLITLFAVAILLVIASSLMYFAENQAQPKKFTSIPAAMWWGVATLTTVGYGDIYPVTIAGKVLGGFVAILGIGLFALPAGILGSGFVEEFQARRKRKDAEVVCPHCGNRLERDPER